MTFKYLVSICLSSAACFQTPSTFPSYNCIDKVNSCTLYFRGAASLTCSQQYVVYVLGVASPELALQQQHDSSILLRPNISKSKNHLKPLPYQTLSHTTELYLGVSQSCLSHLQLVQNAAARLLIGTRKRESITPVFGSKVLEWFGTTLFISLTLSPIGT